MEFAKKSNQTSLNEWVLSYFGSEAHTVTITPITGDASFKVFYRVTHDHKNYMLMSAPLGKEKVTEFYEIDKLLIERGVNAPKILSVDLSLGYFLMEDFGELLYSQALSSENMNDLYRKALAALLQIQAGPLPALPCFDKVLIQTEFSYFTEWCLKLIGLKLSTQEEGLLNKLLAEFIQIFEEQPQVLVHRDYHSRNLLVVGEQSRTPGIIDFQDSVIGPITYDIVSLLKDCYLTWPIDKLKPLLEDFYLALRAQNKGKPFTFEQFQRWYDWTGLQRHIKVLGIFARLYLRDNRSGYLHDMPRVVSYVLSVSQQYPELVAFYDWTKQRLLPALIQYWEKQQISVLATPKDQDQYHALLMQEA